MVHDELVLQARRLISAGDGAPSQADLRRSVSSAYYAVFHGISYAVSTQIVGKANDLQSARTLVRRSLQHSAMKEACVGFASGTPKDQHRQASGNSPLGPLQKVANIFVALQAQRHVADYDFSRSIKRTEALVAIEDASNAISILNSYGVKRSKSAKVFFLSMLLHPLLKLR